MADTTARLEDLRKQKAASDARAATFRGMRPKVLAAAGYGEFDPSVPNDSADHRAQNRRIEIVLQPNLADLPPLDDGAATAPAPATK